MRNAAIVSAGLAKFGIREASYKDLITEAGQACFEAAGGAIKPQDIDGFIICTVMPERTAVQSHTASMAEECLGIRPSTMSLRVEHMCQSGNLGIRTACAYIMAGLCETVMVVGAEKLQVPVLDEIFLNMSTGLDRDWEACQGVTAPIMFDHVHPGTYEKIRHHQGTIGQSGRKKPDTLRQKPVRPVSKRSNPGTSTKRQKDNHPLRAVRLFPHQRWGGGSNSDQRRAG